MILTQYAVYHVVYVYVHYSGAKHTHKPLCTCMHHYCAYTVQHQASIINDLLDFETLKGASVAAKVTRLDLDATVHSVVRMFNNTVTSKVREIDTAQCKQCTANILQY
jgi:hypothetical protein